MKANIITDYEQYKVSVRLWVEGVLIGARMNRKDDEANLKGIELLAAAGLLVAPFVFQDETTAHFNHDVVKECQRRLSGFNGY